MSFSQSTIENLEYYVYLLIDPRDNQIFYIGKGVGNRCFSHVEEALVNNNDSEKCDVIREIAKSGNEVLYKILRHGLTEKESFEVESSCIDLFKDQISNIVLGHRSETHGIMTINELEQRYVVEEILEFDEDVMIININNEYKRNMSMNELYEATRKSWIVNLEKASKIKYVITSYKGISRAVFEVDSWQSSAEAKRSEFIGKEASSSIRDKYMNKSLTAFITVGAQNPIKYVYKAAEISKCA